MESPAARTIDCAFALTAPERPVERDRAIRIENGRIVAVTAADGPVAPFLALPALVNAHDHGRPIRTSSVGAGNKPLETWLLHLAVIPSVDPYLAAVVALGNAALGGAGVVMMHYTRTQGFTDLPTEAAEIARAARDVGVRLGFAVSMKDRNPLVYGDSAPLLAMLPTTARGEIEKRLLWPPLQPKDFVALVDDVAAAAAGPLVDVQYGPNGVQWCSDALLEHVAEASARTGRRVHMHLLETRYQRAFADATFPDGVVKHLDAIGLLSPRLSLAHCVWARPDELELLAERGVTLVNNNSSNLHLRSGMAPVARMVTRGCRVALGIDNCAFDEDDDSLRELRLAHLLHVGTGFTTAVSRAQTLRMAVGNGRLSVTNVDDGGAIAPGAPADLLLIDWTALDDDRLYDRIDPLDLVFGRAAAKHIHELIVGGRSVVKDGKVLGVDLPAARAEVVARMRAAMPDSAALAAALPALQRVVAAHFEPGCC